MHAWWRKGTTVLCNRKNAINKLVMKLNVETVSLGLVVGSLGHVFCVYTNEYANVLVEIFSSPCLNSIFRTCQSVASKVEASGGEAFPPTKVETDGH